MRSINNLQVLWDRHPSVITLAVASLIANAVALIAVLYLLLTR